MSSRQVLIKTPLGRSEIENQNGILPREARTLLILVDGKATIEDYREKLSQTAMFQEAGGVDQSIQLLFDLGYVVIQPASSAGAASATPEAAPASREPAPVVPTPAAADSTAISDDAPTVSAEVVVLEERRPENRQSAVPVSPSEAVNEQVPLDQVRSTLAEFLESSGDPSSNWSWLMKLEACSSRDDYLRFIRAMEERMRKLPRPITKLAKQLGAA